MRRRLTAIALTTCVMSGFVSPGAAAQCTGNEDDKLTASDGTSGDAFGRALAAQGDVAVIASFWDTDKGSDSGSAYVFRFNGTTWAEEQKIVASDGSAWEEFGHAVAVDGDVVLVGVPFDDDLGSDSGSVYVYRFDGVTWNEEQKLTASDGEAYDNFGFSVAVSGDVALVGSWYDEDGGVYSGSAYVFRHDGSTWVEEQKLLGSTVADGDFFGWDVALEGDLALVSAVGDDALGSKAGSAYVFRHDGTSYVEEQKLTAADGQAQDNFGISVSLNDDVAVVGAWLDDDLGGSSGSAYVFRYDGSTWAQEQKLLAPDGAGGDNFGNSVAVRGDTVLVGSPEDDDVGSAYVFSYHGSGWVQRRKLVASDPSTFDLTGWGVTLSDSSALVGAEFDDDLGSNSGSVYDFRLADLALDTNRDTASSGDTLTFSTCGGLPTGLTMLFVVDVNGSPFFLRLASGRFGSDGEWSFGGVVSPGLSGLMVEFQSYGFFRAGKVGTSGRASVTFL